MIYNFNGQIDRSGLSSSKHDSLMSVFGTTDVLPMWVADMDLPTAQPILDAIDLRNKQASFGYTIRPNSYVEAVHDWQKRRNGWDFDTNLLSECTGVVPALSALVKQLTKENDEVLFFTPVYGPFFSVVEKWNRKPLFSRLKNSDGYYTIDVEDFEAKLKRKPAMVIVCSPHNPIGRVWKKEELETIAKLCLKHNVLVVSDEIHSDLILNGNKHTTMANISPEINDNTITCISSTKTFNLAGLNLCGVVFPNKELKLKFDTLWENLDVSFNNPLSLAAVEAAFNHGEEWLSQLIAHLEGNASYIKEFIDNNIPQIKLYLAEGTYLLWLDCRGLNMAQDELRHFFINTARLGLNSGTDYGTHGTGFMRMNIACSKNIVIEAMDRLKEAIETI